MHFLESILFYPGGGRTANNGASGGNIVKDGGDETRGGCQGRSSGYGAEGETKGEAVEARGDMDAFVVGGKRGGWDDGEAEDNGADRSGTNVGGGSLISRTGFIRKVNFETGGIFGIGEVLEVSSSLEVDIILGIPEI